MTAMNALDHAMPRLRCPASGQPLVRRNGALVSRDGLHEYAVTEGGTPLFAPDPARSESRAQKRHYDRIAGLYVRSLTLPHTEVYGGSLDRILLDAFDGRAPGYVGEICCGRGEAIRLLRRHFDDRLRGAIGIDISPQMIRAAAGELADRRFLFAQGDATALPVADGAFDCVVILGGIHHVPDRERLFAEVFRTLRPGGRLYFREPLNDFWLWRLLRAVLYRLSPTLDAATEHPLRERSARRALEAAGLRVVRWEPCGLIGFCLFMNGDVLIVNRLLRFVPGIRRIARMVARLDGALLKVPGLRRAGLQVVGVAEKPAGAFRVRCPDDRDGGAGHPRTGS